MTEAEKLKIETKKRHSFAKRVVRYCILIGTLITAVALRDAWVTASFSSGTLTALLGFWGGELLILCVKCIFDKHGEVKKYEAQAKQQNSSMEETI